MHACAGMVRAHSWFGGCLRPGCCVREGGAPRTCMASGGVGGEGVGGASGGGHGTGCAEAHALWRAWCDLVGRGGVGRHTPEVFVECVL